MKKFIILSTQRSGSTYLVSCLSSHPQIQAYSEIFQNFGKKYLNDPNPPMRYKFCYEKYRRESLTRKLADRFRRKTTIYRYLEQIYSIPKDMRAVGFKFMYNQAVVYPAVVDWLKEHNVRVIHLIRENLLKTIVSCELARKRGLYTSKESLVDDTKVFLDPDKLQAKLKSRKKLIEANRLLFRENPYIEINYETLIESKEFETKRLLDFLGIEEFQELTSELKKMSSNSLGDLIENYDEVSSQLKDTVFEYFLG